MRFFLYIILLVSFCWSQSESEIEKEIKQENAHVLFLYQGEKYQEALSLAKKVHKRAKQKLGKHILTLNSTYNLTLLYQKKGEHDKAEPFCIECFELGKSKLGKDHPIVLTYMNNLAASYEHQGKYSEAEVLFEECLELSKNTLGENHLTTLICMNNFGALYRKWGKYNKAESLHLKCLELSKNKFKKYHFHIYNSANGLALLYKDQGKYHKALPLFLECLKLRQDQLGKDHPDTIISMNNLGSLYRVQSEYEKAEPLLSKGLELAKNKLGKDHPDTFSLINNLSLLYVNQGKYGKAKSLLSGSLELAKNKLGKDHPDTLTLIDNLASLYRYQGKNDKAEFLFSQCLQLSKNRLGENHPATISSMNNLASLYSSQEKYNKAEPLYIQSLRLSEKKLGKDHPYTFTLMDNLASLYKHQEKYDEAELLYSQCLELRKNKLGEGHRSTITSINNIATLYDDQGKHNKAELLYSQCMKLAQKRLGTDHPDTIISMNNLARIYCQQGKYLDAQKLGHERMVSLSSYRNSLFAGLDKNVQVYFIAQQKSPNNMYLSLNLQINNKNSPYNFCYFSLTQKALLLSTASHMQNLNIQDGSPEIQKLFKELIENQRLLSHLLLNPPQKMQSSMLIQKQKELKETIDKIESKLSLLSSRFKSKFEKIELQNIQNNLNKKEVVIDFLIFDKINLDSLLYTERYIVASIIQKNKITLVPIGSFIHIEKALNEYRETMSSKTKTLYSEKLSQKLYNLIWQPLSPHLKNTKNIIIVPDAELHMLPFSSLCDEQGQYLIEKIHLETCSSLRQIALDRETATNKGEVVLFSDPNYEKFLDEKETLGLSFSKLPGTAKESKNITEILVSKNIPYKSYLLDQATKQNLLQIKNPQILHLATHGFYLKREKEQGIINPFLLEKERGTANIQIFEDTMSQTSIFFDPLTYCGLAFTGASNSSSEKSILLGTEIPSLSLWNTELVVLSACETGVGTTETVTSEGKIYKAEEVYSLRRAFEEAGARAVLSTMWPAHDDATQKFMTRFYELYLDKVPPQQALRAVQLEFLRDSQYSHPYYWANFVLVGTDKHFPEHTKKIKPPEDHSYMNMVMICLGIITIIVIVFCLIKVIQLRRSNVAKVRLARKQKRTKVRESK